MRLFLIILIYLCGGCTGSDKKTIAGYENMPVVNDGEILFKVNCASCHKVDKDFTGPALKGSLKRWGGDKKTMYEFIREPRQSSS